MVKASLTGSIIGNVLLVLGASMIAGGMKHERQKFNQTAAGLGSSMLVLAAVSLIIPALFHFTAADRGVRIEHELSLLIAVVLFIIYCLSLAFSLKTHRHVFDGDGHDTGDPGEPHWSYRTSLIVLTVVTMLIGVFVGVILVALVGNAAEHSTAILMATKNKMDLAFGIAVGSSMQIALFVAPVLVFASYLFDHPLDLIFTPFEVAAVAMSVLILGFVSMDGVALDGRGDARRRLCHVGGRLLLSTRLSLIGIPALRQGPTVRCSR